jgi:hypothetical protein
MSILGKILAALCLLAAGLFVYLAAADAGKRQQWAYAVYRYDLLEHGLPLEKEERDPAEGDRLVDKQGDKTLQQLAQAAGGQSVPRTQQEAVEAVRARLRGDIDKLDGDEAKRKKLVDVLRPLARTLGEREAILLLSRDELEAKLKVAFDDALQPAFDEASGTPKRDPELKRRAIAHLLFNLDNQDAWHQWLLVVIGLQAYIDEANRQADAMADMAERVRLAMLQDQAAFETSHQKVIKDLQVLAEELQGKKTFLLDQQKLKKKNEDLANARKGERDKLKENLENSRKATEAALAEQARYEKALFEARRRLRDAAAANQKLEEEIRGREKVGR